jgi:hypothetical protein
MSSNHREQLVEDYKYAFNSGAGKRVLEDLCQFTRFQTPSFDESEDTSGRKMAFREGQRSVISYILTHTQISLAEFQKKVRQAHAELEGDE